MTWPFSRIILYVALALMLGPFFILIGQAFSSGTEADREAWNFVFNSTLPDVFKNTLWLIFSTVLLSALLGCAQAVLIVLTDIKLKPWLHLLFVLPLIFPLYVLSYIYVGALEYSGPILSYLRDEWGYSLSHYIDFKGPLVIAGVFSLALSPYVYLFIKSFLENIDRKIIWSAQTLGKGPWGLLFSIIIPQSFPWVCSASILVGLEVLSDFGGVSVFNFETFSIAIYQSWMGLFSINTAIKISLFPILLAILLYGMNDRLQGRFIQRERANPISIFKLGKSAQILLFLLLSGYAFLALGLPIGQLLVWALSSQEVFFKGEFFSYLYDTVILGLCASVLIGLLALIFVFLNRFYWSPKEKFLSLFLKLGYAFPGTIVAIAMMALFSLSGMNFFGPWAYCALLAGLVVKFFSPAIEMQNKTANLIHKKFDWLSRSLGKTPSQTFFHVHFPLLRSTLFSSLLLVFLEVIKEMPITLILRPHGVNTLSTKIYELTSEGEWEQSSYYALVLTICGAFSLLLNELARKQGRT